MTSYTDNFEASSCGVFVDSNGSNSYDAADTAVYIDELAPDVSRRVFVVCDIPASRVNADFSAVNLTATAASGSAAATQGAALVATSGARPWTRSPWSQRAMAGSDDLASDGKVGTQRLPGRGGSDRHREGHRRRLLRSGDVQHQPQTGTRRVCALRPLANSASASTSATRWT